MKRRICAVTSSRADYGLLHHPLRALRQNPNFELQLAVTGTHLAPEFGATVSEIVQDGFDITGRVEMLVSSDSPVGVAKSLGLGTIGFADFFANAQPDLVMLLGDRFEMLAAASAALVAKLPIAHLCGGDVTEGAFDDAVRHSLTKMSHLHFVTTEESRKRVIQLGEDPRRVFRVGSPGLDFIRTFAPIDRAALAVDLQVSADKPWLLVTFHPVTLDDTPSAEQVDALLGALDAMGQRFSIIFTQPNADNEGRTLTQQIQHWCGLHPNSVFFNSLGQNRYLSAMKHATAIVGNSSSGLYEAPSFGVPTVNIGRRQDGRPRATSVIDCPSEREAIVKALESAAAGDWRDTVNPFGDGYTSERIVRTLEQVPDFKNLLIKQFHNVSVDE